MAIPSPVRRLYDQAAPFIPAGILLVTWGLLYEVLGLGKLLLPHVLGSLWIQIPGMCVRALLLASAALVAMSKAAHAAGWLRRGHAAFALFAVLLQLGSAGAWCWASYEAATIVKDGLVTDHRETEELRRLTLKGNEAADRGEPQCSSLKMAQFVYRVFGVPTTYRDDDSKAARRFVPTPAQAAEWEATRKRAESSRQLLGQMSELFAQFYRWGCIDLAGLGLTALAACIGAARLRRSP